MSPILLMIQLGKHLRRHVMISLIPRDLITNSFQGLIRRCQKRVELKGVLSQMNNMCDFDDFGASFFFSSSSFGASLTIGLT